MAAVPCVSCGSGCGVTLPLCVSEYSACTALEAFLLPCSLHLVIRGKASCVEFRTATLFLVWTRFEGLVESQQRDPGKPLRTTVGPCEPAGKVQVLRGSLTLFSAYNPSGFLPMLTPHSGFPALFPCPLIWKLFSYMHISILGG